MPAQLPLSLPHQDARSRDDLIVSASNRLAVEAVDRWPNWRHSVLLIVGPPGSGKSHLLNAWLEASDGRQVAVGDGAGLLAEPGFRIAIDDVDRSPLAETDLFAFVNAARLGGGTVLATARVAPGQMPLALPDLRSRLAAATRAELGAPDDGLLCGVLVKLFADRQLEIAPAHLRYLADRMDRSLDGARRLVAAIDSESLAAREKIGPRLFKRVLDRDVAAMRHQTVASVSYSPATED